MAIVFAFVSHTLRNGFVQPRELRSELLDLCFEVFAFVNEAIEFRRHASYSLARHYLIISTRYDDVSYRAESQAYLEQCRHGGRRQYPTGDDHMDKIGRLPAVSAASGLWLRALA